MTTRLLKSSENINGLPVGFQEVEYLKSTGTQYIDTGINAKSTLKTDIHFEVVDRTQGGHIFGGRTVTSGGRGYGVYLPTSGGISFDYETRLTSNVSTTNGYKYRVVKDGASNTLYVNGVQSYTGNNTDATFDLNVTIALFYMKDSNTSFNTSVKCKVFCFKIWDNNTLVRDFIPALNPAGRPCMYDLVEKKAYYNLGTGEFTYGREIIPVEYLESTGTQYIDTGIKGKSGLSAYIDCEYTSLTETSISMLDARDTNNRIYLCHVGKPSTTYYFYYGYGSAIQSNTIPTTNTRYKVETNLGIGSQSMNVNGTQIVTGSSSTSYSLNYNLFLFGNNSSGSATFLAKAKLYSCKISDGSSLVRDFIPAIDENNTPYMFDKVTHSCYLNAGTGTFNYGKKLYSSKVRLYKDSGAKDNELPTGFKRVEYLQSSGTQYINTGFVFSDSTHTYKWDVGAQAINTSDSNYNWFCGFFEGGANSAGTYADTTTNYRFYAIGTYYQNGQVITSPLTNGDKYGIIRNVFTITNFAGTLPIILFGRNQSNGVKCEATKKVFYYKIYDNNVLVRNFIPCLDINNTPCMYDLVEKKPYYNQGTGSFTVGRHIIPVEYLQSSGTQYILTGFTPTVNTDFEIELSSTKTSTNWAMGCPTWVGVHYKGADGQIGVTNSSTSDFQQYVNYARDNTRITMKLQGNTVYANGVSLRTITRRAGTLDFALFGYRDASRGATLLFTGSIYKTKLWDNGTLVHYFIPAIDENNTPFMFDKVTGTCFLNAGTGSFTYGAKVPNKVRLSQSTEIRFPKGYTEVEYLASNGNQYIDTGVLGNGEFDVDYQFYQTENSSNAIFAGTRSASQHLNFGQRSTGNTGGFSMAYLGEYWQAISSPAINTNVRVQISYKSGSQTGTLNGTAMTSKSLTGTEATNLSIYIFKRHHYGTDNVTGLVGRIYYFKLWNNGALVRYFIPALDPNGRPCMWDVVTKQPFYNQGSGEFTYGRSIQQVEYLESSGTQYIDTLWSPLSNNLQVKFKAKSIGNPASTAICGAEKNGVNPRWIFILYGQNTDTTKTFPLTGDWNNNAKGFTFTSGSLLEIDWTTSSTSTTITDSVSGTTYTQDFGSTINYSNNPVTLKLFQNIDTQKSSIQMNYYQIWDNNTLVRNYVPAIDSNNVGFMFDRVTHTIFDNKGTGSFTYGSSAPNIIRN